MMRSLQSTWRWLIEPTHTDDPRRLELSRRMNVILLTLFTWGVVADIYYVLRNGPGDTRSVMIFIMLFPLTVVYYLNRRGLFVQATLWMLTLFIASTFVSAYLQYTEDARDLSGLYYLAIPIVIAEMFLPFGEYLAVTGVTLAGVLAFSFVNMNAQLIIGFLFVLAVLLSISGLNRRWMEREQAALAGRFTRGQSMLKYEQRRSAQLALLEQVGRKIAESLDEREILQRTVQAVIDHFGYAEAAISLLVDEKMLEVAAIAGTQDYGYRPGFQQELGSGIIGYVGQTRAAYVAKDVAKDPYYYSTEQHEGSAVSVPILDEKELIGVLYIESEVRDSFTADDVQVVQTLATQVAAAVQRARMYASAQEHLRVMSAVQSVSDIVASSLDPDEIFQSVVHVLRETFGYSHASVYLLERDFLHLGAQSGYDEDHVYRKIHISQGIIGLTAKTRQPQFIADVAHDPHYLRAATDVGSEICVPLLKNDVVLGTLNVESPASSPLSQTDLDLLQLLAGPIALAVDNARLHSQVKAMAMTDAVTGLFNRHAFEDALTSELARAERLGAALSLIIFDIDSFKEYNDIWGHPAGDERLRAIADLIGGSLRKYDISARYGGDEFAIILPNTERDGALRFAQRLLAATQGAATAAASDGKGVPGFTLSIGTASFPRDAHTVAALLLAADQAELRAKRLGKNQIFSAGVVEA